MDIKLSDLEYIILPGKFCDSNHLQTYENAYYFWHDNWVEVFKSLNTDKKPNPDDFFRQDFVPVITHKDKIVAIHLYTLYDLRLKCTQMHSYLYHNFTSAYFEKLQQMNIAQAMSMEALFVDPNYRKSLSGFKLSEIIISLGQKVFQNLTDAEAIIAPARIDNKVAQTAYSLGFQTILKGYPLNNVTVDLITCQRNQITESKDENSKFAVQYLWKNHLNATKEDLKIAS